MTATRLRLFADYFQLHVMDEDAEDDLGEAWTQEAVSDGIAVSRRTLGIGTAVDMDVTVTVELLDRPPGDDSDAFDHVVEASIEVPTGRIAVLGCTDYLPDAARFEVPKGSVRVRASRTNLANVRLPDEEGYDDPEGMEQVHLRIWPAPCSAPVVIKRWVATGTTNPVGD
ncbi:hypothetical protein [Streptomyces seoulensis]|uniref:hypothetical protein n=1 Tax=Streptomyces seoulensis TaxID=73044 RepID=UPI001FCA5C29|nr:hypothetical protein [Streptomyces seoulensis]BDH06929.1 hypothetical protein HEK131_41560 [Streptomyces seoulensis]